MKKMKILMIPMIAAFMICGILTSVNALTIDPNTTPNWTGTENNVPDILTTITGIMGFSAADNELYKKDVAPAVEYGPFKDSYSTVFDTNLEDATITWDGGNYINGSPLYVLVKDGKHQPAWYLFSINWNGKETIYLQDFWKEPTQGDISHVALYGKSVVPEPTTMLLLGLGLVGLAGVGRKFKK